MSSGISSDPDLKSILKEALAETLNENRGLFVEVFAEVLEDFALHEAIRKGENTEFVSREDIDQVLSRRR